MLRTIFWQDNPAALRRWWLRENSLQFKCVFDEERLFRDTETGGSPRIKFARTACCRIFIGKRRQAKNFCLPPYAKNFRDAKKKRLPKLKRQEKQKPNHKRRGWEMKGAARNFLRAAPERSQ